MSVPPFDPTKNGGIRIRHKKSTTLFLTANAVIAALYAALTIALAPISYGPVQFRVSEALTVLPFLMPGSVLGITLGCLLANLYTGNIMDMIFGTLATYLAGVTTAHFGKKGNTVKNRMLGCGMPVAFNAVIVGAVLTWGYGIQEFANPIASFAFNGLTVGLGAQDRGLALRLGRSVPDRLSAAGQPAQNEVLPRVYGKNQQTMTAPNGAKGALS